jgi:hypothetical protein
MFGAWMTLSQGNSGRNDAIAASNCLIPASESVRRHQKRHAIWAVSPGSTGHLFIGWTSEGVSGIMMIGWFAERAGYDACRTLLVRLPATPG